MVRHAYDARAAYADPRYSAVVLLHTPHAEELKFVSEMQQLMRQDNVVQQLRTFSPTAAFKNQQHRFRLSSDVAQSFGALAIANELPAYEGRAAFADRLENVSQNFLTVVVAPGHRAQSGQYAVQGLQLDVDIAHARPMRNLHEDPSPVSTFTGTGMGTVVASRAALAADIQARAPEAMAALQSGDVILTKRFGPLFKPSACVARVAKYLFMAPPYAQVFLRAINDNADSPNWLPPTTHESPWPGPKSTLKDVMRLRAMAQ